MKRPYLLVDWEPGRITIQGCIPEMTTGIPLIETAARQAFTIHSETLIGHPVDAEKPL